MFGKGVRLFYSVAGDCHGQYLGMAELKQDRYDSQPTFKRAMSILASVF